MNQEQLMQDLANGKIPAGMGVETPKIHNVYTGRVAGVLGGVLSAGLDIASNGPKFSNIVGGVVGTGAGYYSGKFTDSASQLLGLATRSPGMNIPGAVMSFGIGYGISSGMRAIMRGADGVVSNAIGTVTPEPIDSDEPLNQLNW